MKRLALAISLLFLASGTLAGTGTVVRCAKELQHAIATNEDAPLDICASFVQQTIPGFLIADKTGNAPLHLDSRFSWSFAPKPGDEIHVRGLVRLDDSGNYHMGFCTRVDYLGPGTPLPASEISGTDFMSGQFDYKPVLLRGTLFDSLNDEIDPCASMLILKSGSERIPIGIERQESENLARSHRIGDALTFSGVCYPTPIITRKLIGRMLMWPKVIEAAISPADPFDCPDINVLHTTQPTSLSSQDRHRATGRVIAIRDNASALILTADGDMIGAEFASRPLPSYGIEIDVVGLPETDLYSIILTRATWRPSRGLRPTVEPKAVSASVRSLLSEEDGTPRFDSTLLGKTIRTKGTIRLRPSPSDVHRRFYIEDKGFTIPIDIGFGLETPAALALGCVVEITGVCTFDTERWRPNNVFPRIREMAVVTRTPEDIRILARPSWWTPARLMFVIGALLALLSGIFVWNRFLNRLVTRRSRELFHEQVAHYGANLRIDERTRLAVELHDSLSQVLTGVAMEVETAAKFADGARPEMQHHLAIAGTTLKSCRNELRNCLWDLRNQALDEKDMNAAIHRTLLPHVKNVKTTVRFNIPRSRFSDKTAHTILQIIRELTVNAIKHGKATAVQVAGGIEGDLLKFSVTNNGQPFDPDDCPGVLQGHFGLQGIRERIRKFSGTLTVSSPRDQEVRVRITMKIVQPQQTDTDLS